MSIALSFRHLSPVLGTEVLGIDLASPIDADTFGLIENAFAENAVLVFRDQHLDAAALAAFGTRFGHHHWRVGDVVMWDEVATMHCSAGDADPRRRRIMLRTIVHPFDDAVAAG